jgi:ribonuclease HII
MVYGAAYWPENEADEIAAFGFDDSKALTAVKRDGKTVYLPGLVV